MPSDIEFKPTTYGEGQHSHVATFYVPTDEMPDFPQEDGFPISMPSDATLIRHELYAYMKPDGAEKDLRRFWMDRRSAAPTEPIIQSDGPVVSAEQYRDTIGKLAIPPEGTLWEPTAKLWLGGSTKVKIGISNQGTQRRVAIAHAVGDPGASFDPISNGRQFHRLTVAEGCHPTDFHYFRAASSWDTPNRQGRRDTPDGQLWRSVYVGQRSIAR